MRKVVGPNVRRMEGSLVWNCTDFLRKLERVKRKGQEDAKDDGDKVEAS
jgi:hypothetical protein